MKLTDMVCIACGQYFQPNEALIVKATLNKLHQIYWHNNCRLNLLTCCGAYCDDLIWSPGMSQWECGGCGAVKSNDPNFKKNLSGIAATWSGLPPIPIQSHGKHTKIRDFSSLYPDKQSLLANPKCTCGSEKTYGPGGSHSSWCDLKS